MPRKPAAPAEAKAPAPVAETPTIEIVKAPEAPVATTSYFRVKKLSAFMHQIIEIHVDEKTMTIVGPPTMAGKADLPELISGKLYDVAYPHPDRQRKKK